ncbi:MAG TPA: dipeptidase [Candidatus Binatia bacterium]|nr:dipeptidase [Candidatus Binatia bacterium]
MDELSDRTRPRAALACGLLSLALGCRSRPAPPTERDPHQRAIVVDTHSDCTQRITYDRVDFARGEPDLQVDLPKMRAGGLDAEFFSIFVRPWQTRPESYFGEALRQFDAVDAMVRANPDGIAPARTAADVRTNAARRRVSALFGVEGGHALLPGDEAELLAHLRTFAARGARYLTLTWSIASPIGGSSGDDSREQGLTDVGRRIIDEMERLGVLVDVSHVSDALFWDVMRYARKPVLASHSSARALARVPRNMSDDMLRAVGRNGGAVCVNFGSAFLDQDFFAAEQAIWARVRGLSLPPKDVWRTVRDEVARLPPVPLARLVDHVEHVARVAGVDHVCLGSDFDGVPATPAGLEDASKLPALTAALRARGWSDADLEKVLGANVLRVLAAAEPGAG